MSKKSFMKVALEEMEQQEAIAQIEQNNQQTNDSEICTVDQGFHDITDAQNDIEEHIDYIDEVVVDTTDVQDIADFTEVSQDEGLDSTTAEILDVATESLYASLGVRPDTQQYTTENFGSNSTKVKSTKLAVEGFKEFIKTMWEAIKAAFKKMGMYLKHYIGLVFDQNAITIRGANALRDSMKKKSIDKNNKALLGSKVPKIIVSNQIYDLSSGKNPEEFYLNEKDLQSGALVVGKSFKLINTFTQYLNTTDDLKDLIKNEASFNKLTYPDLTEGFTKKYLFENIYVSEPFIGSKQIEVKSPLASKDLKGSEVINAIKVTRIGLIDSATSIDRVFTRGHDKYVIDALNPTVHKDVVDTVVFVSEKIAESQKGYIDLVLKHDKMISQIDAVEQSLGQSEEQYKEYKSRVTAVRTFATEINRLTSEMIKVVSGSLVKSCHAALRLTEQSYKAYLKYQ